MRRWQSLPRPPRTEFLRNEADRTQFQRSRNEAVQPNDYVHIRGAVAVRNIIAGVCGHCGHEHQSSFVLGGGEKLQVRIRSGTGAERLLCRMYRTADCHVQRGPRCGVHSRDISGADQPTVQRTVSKCVPERCRKLFFCRHACQGSGQCVDSARREVRNTLLWQLYR